MKLSLPAPLRRLRSAAAIVSAKVATSASKATGRGSGGMIGGLVASKVDPDIMSTLINNRPTVLVTGTNGKSTTTRMLAAAMRSTYTVATNEGGDNMDAGIISALLAGRNASHVVLEVDELHVPAAIERLKPDALILLNLSRDQLDRVGEINKIERVLRDAVRSRPEMTVIANCDDVLVTSVAFDAEKVTWVGAGTGWQGESVTCPRTESRILHDGRHWSAEKSLLDGRTFARPTPSWEVDGDTIHSPSGDLTLDLNLPGQANRGNAAQAIAAATVFNVPVSSSLPAVNSVNNVAGRYSTIQVGEHQVHLLLAKNPAGWQEALSMVDRTADGLVIAVNGQVADGEDLSWLWDVQFEDFENISVKASGERGTDLAVRLTYADIDHALLANPVDAIAACPPGRIEVLANYTAFRDLKKALEKGTEQ